MASSKLFIGSSENTHEFAVMLREEVNKVSYIDARTWKEALDACGSQSKIEALEQWIKYYDFAIFLLARADLDPKGLATDSKSRDDCIFEAGLFMAAIGRSRCLLFSSVDSKELPSDLAGVNFFKFVEPSNLSKYDACRSIIQSMAASIKNWIQKQVAAGVQFYRPLSADDLIFREQCEDLGGDLREDQVVVASFQPPQEITLSSVKRIRRNMDNNITYVYFFLGDSYAGDKVSQLLQLIALADFEKELEERDTFKTRCDLVSTHKDEIIQYLKEICTYNRLNIYFFRNSFDLEYCIHNATSEKYARLYLKQDKDNNFVEWKTGKSAYEFSRGVRERNRVPKEASPDAIFHAAKDFDLTDEDFLRPLQRGINKYFGSIASEVLDLCLRGVKAATTP